MKKKYTGCEKCKQRRLWVYKKLQGVKDAITGTKRTTKDDQATNEHNSGHGTETGRNDARDSELD